MDEKKSPEESSNRMNFVEMTPYLKKAKEIHKENEPKAMVEAIIAVMRESGADEALVDKQRKMLEAKFGVGSWRDVLSDHEKSLQERKEQKDVHGQLSDHMHLINMAINAGDKEKAQQYLLEAERFFETVTAVDIENSLPAPSKISGETILQMQRAELERLRNWIF